MKTQQFINELKAALGERLKAVVLYGSAAAGDFVEGASGLDVMIVAARLTAADLLAAAPAIGRWQAAGNPVPELFTPEELAASADVFPIELTDMRQSRQVLFGDDPLANITIDMLHYRLQLERDLKTKLLLLRRKYVACADRPAEVARLMAASVANFLVLFRAALRLYDEQAPADKSDAAIQLAKHIPFDAMPLFGALKLKSQPPTHAAGQASLEGTEGITQLFAHYLASIEQVVQAVDRHLRTTPTRSVSEGSV